MKYLIMIGILACAFVTSAFTAETVPNQTVRFGVDVDYVWVAMDQVNKQLGKGTGVTKSVNGIDAMANLDFALAPFLMVGARVGYLYCLPASASFIFGLQTSTILSSLIPVEAGLIANFDIPGVPVSVMAGIYAGYGFAMVSYNNVISAFGQTANFTQYFNGGGLMGEALATVNFKVSPTLSLNVNGGYRLAQIAQVVQSQDASYTILGVNYVYSTKDTVLKDSDNNVLAFDFSGFNIGVGLSVAY